MLDNLMAIGNFTSKSAYIEEMIFAVEDIFAAFYTFHKVSEQASTDADKNLTWSMFTQYLLALLRRLGWAGYRDQQESMKKGERK